MPGQYEIGQNVADTLGGQVTCVSSDGASSASPALAAMTKAILGDNAKFTSPNTMDSTTTCFNCAVASLAMNEQSQFKDLTQAPAIAPPDQSAAPVAQAPSAPALA